MPFSKILAQSPYGVVVKMLDSDITVIEFKHKLSDYNHFQINTIGKGMNFLITPAMS